MIRWGILGCGDVTEVKSGPALQKAAGSQLVAVMRRNGELAADFARRHGVPRWYDSAEALVRDPDVDIVYVAAPPGAHLDGARLAAAAGKPAYVEKPMARHTPECDAMIAVLAQARQKLFVAYYRRALPRFAKVKEVLETGTLGTLTSVAYRQAMPLPVNADTSKGGWRITVENSGGGLLLDVGSHVLDLLDWYLGPLPLENLHAQTAHLGPHGLVEDSIAVAFRTASGVPGSATWNFASAVREDHLEFTGTAGRISLCVFGNDPIRLERADSAESFDIPHPPHVHQPLVQTIVDELRGRGTCPSTGESARRTSAVMDRILERYYGGRADAFWDRPASWPRG